MEGRTGFRASILASSCQFSSVKCTPSTNCSCVCAHVSVLMCLCSCVWHHDQPWPVDERLQRHQFINHFGQTDPATRHPHTSGGRTASCPDLHRGPWPARHTSSPRYHRSRTASATDRPPQTTSAATRPRTSGAGGAETEHHATTWCSSTISLNDDPLDANEWQEGQWRSFEQVRRSMLGHCKHHGTTRLRQPFDDLEDQ